MKRIISLKPQSAEQQAREQQIPATSEELFRLQEAFNAALAQVSQLERERDAVRAQTEAAEAKVAALEQTLRTVIEQEDGLGFYVKLGPLNGPSKDVQMAKLDSFRALLASTKEQADV